MGQKMNKITKNTEIFKLKIKTNYSILHLFRLSSVGIGGTILGLERVFVFRSGECATVGNILLGTALKAPE